VNLYTVDLYASNHSQFCCCHRRTTKNTSGSKGRISTTTVLFLRCTGLMLELTVQNATLDSQPIRSVIVGEVIALAGLQIFLCTNEYKKRNTHPGNSRSPINKPMHTCDTNWRKPSSRQCHVATCCSQLHRLSRL